MLSHPEIPDPLWHPFFLRPSRYNRVTAEPAGPLIKHRVLSHPFQPSVLFTQRSSLQLYRPPSTVTSLPHQPAKRRAEMVCGHRRCIVFAKSEMISKALQMIWFRGWKRLILSWMGWMVLVYVLMLQVYPWKKINGTMSGNNLEASFTSTVF